MRFFFLNAGNGQLVNSGSGSKDPSNGGVFGPYNLGAKVVGLVYCGFFDNAGSYNASFLVKVSPNLPTVFQTGSPNSVLDAIPQATPGSWFRIGNPSQTWFFETQDTGSGGGTYCWALIEDECFEGSHL